MHIMYKGYYYDEETKLYYCMSRYYSPEFKRFISPDKCDYLEAKELNGLNLYAYCNNNPVNKWDPTGHFPFLLFITALILLTPVGGSLLQVATSIVSYIGFAIASLFDEDIRNNMNEIGWNPFNTNESATLKSKKVSFYKGVPIIRTSSGGRSGSFGAILLARGSNVDTLKHERGHNWQLMMMGIATYGITVGIPSAARFGECSNTDSKYYNAPWETLADILGGVSQRKHTNVQKDDAWFYYAISLVCFPFAIIYWF